MSDTLYFLLMVFNLHNTNNTSVQSGRKSPVRPSIIVNTYSTQRILDSAKEEGKHGIVHYERAPSLGELKNTSRTNSISDSIYKSASSFNKLEDISQNLLSKSDPTLNSHCDNSSSIHTKKTRSLPNLSRKSQLSQFNSLEKVDTTSLESVNEFFKEKDLKLVYLKKKILI
ncbi:hypothetical protein TUBRATIS_29010 [Tubulinosema ratisbonensis]|uniref:Uncharacterized protein n=1 Tax=Tubulinosema ratisbonensis TaxID=291195 RepID=A0A437AI12_9MICR|nr:hypothetical protein TUBRATIS_29010 [Tubulinosema ratisbonensis]